MFYARIATSFPYKLVFLVKKCLTIMELFAARTANYVLSYYPIFAYKSYKAHP